MQCPVCNVSLNITDRQGIEIDYCPKCRGVWLDRGELDKLIDRSTQMTAAAPPPRPTGSAPYVEQPQRRYDHDDDDDYRRHGGDPRQRRKRSGFLGELFDFD